VGGAGIIEQEFPSKLKVPAPPSMQIQLQQKKEKLEIA
jgi:hypothetical protein